MDIYELGDMMKANLVLTRPSGQGTRWTAKFHDAELKKGVMLESVYGDANNPQDAIDDYVQKIKDGTLVIAAMSKTMRREFGIPNRLTGGTL